MCRICDMTEELCKVVLLRIDDTQAFSRLLIELHKLDIFDFELQNGDF